MSGIKHPLTIEFALLGLIRQQPMHPYEVYQRLCTDPALGDIWRIKQANLYALLRRLEEEGFLVAFTETPGNRPPRRVLSLTMHGHEVFSRWMRTPVTRGRDVRLEFLAKLYFAHQEGTDAVQVLLAHQRRACQQLLDTLDQKVRALPHDQSYRRLVTQFRRGQIQAMLAWLETCRAELAAGAPLPSQERR